MADEAMLTQEAAAAMKEATRLAAKRGYGILVYAMPTARSAPWITSSAGVGIPPIRR